MKQKLITLILVLTILFHAHSAHALIVWDGEIVPAWPEEFYQTALAKRSASTSDAPYGFFPHPRDTTFGIVMIVDFSDQPAKFTKEQVNEWLNKKGYSTSYANGSVHDYFFQISNGKFNLFNDVFGYYRAKNPKSYYENANGYEKASELVNEMISYFDPFVDFSKYDNDKNGTTESISLVYAGSGQTWGKGLWPHSGRINQKRDGVTLGAYNMSDMGSGLGLYVFCHETGHMIFGWPDLYWFGDYCIMGNRMSDVNPVPVNDFFRADQGWIPTVTITATDNAVYTTSPGQTAYRFVNPSNKNQMYLWSYVGNTGRYSTLKGKGLLVFKYDNAIKGNTSGTSRQLYVVEADGNNAMAASQWPSPGSSSTDFFYSSNKSTFSSSTSPASLWGLKIYNTSQANETMTFYVGTGSVTVQQKNIHSTLVQIPESRQMQLYNLAGQKVRAVNIIPTQSCPVSSGLLIGSNYPGLIKNLIIH